MLAALCSAPRAVAPRPTNCRRQLQRRPQAAPRPARQQQRCLAFQEGNGGSGSKLHTTSEQLHAVKMINLASAYFHEVMTNGDTEACHRLLSPNVEHKDMVRSEGRYGISDIQRYIRDLKKAYPNIYVMPSKFGPVDSCTMFVAFEGRAAKDTALFKGVDLFCFNVDATKVTEIQVYRSNWLGAAGHEERKRAAQQGQPRVAT